jgi:hypothetical protein
MTIRAAAPDSGTPCRTKRRCVSSSSSRVTREPMLGSSVPRSARVGAGLQQQLDALHASSALTRTPKPSLLGFVVAALLHPGPLEAPFDQVTNPLGVQGLRAAMDEPTGTGWLLTFVVLGLGVRALVLRLRGARGDERQRLKWVLTVSTVVGVVAVALMCSWMIWSRTISGGWPSWAACSSRFRSPPGSRSCAIASTTSTSSPTGRWFTDGTHHSRSAALAQRVRRTVGLVSPFVWRATSSNGVSGAGGPATARRRRRVACAESRWRRRYPGARPLGGQGPSSGRCDRKSALAEIADGRWRRVRRAEQHVPRRRPRGVGVRRRVREDDQQVIHPVAVDISRGQDIDVAVHPGARAENGRQTRPGRSHHEPYRPPSTAEQADRCGLRVVVGVLEELIRAGDEVITAVAVDVAGRPDRVVGDAKPAHPTVPLGQRTGLCRGAPSSKNIENPGCASSVAPRSTSARPSPSTSPAGTVSAPRLTQHLVAFAIVSTPRPRGRDRSTIRRRRPPRTSNARPSHAAMSQRSGSRHPLSPMTRSSRWSASVSPAMAI